MPRRLKVFATDMGFVRAVVAAPSRKAALEAWGVRDDLFARGTAEEVDDQSLIKEAIASPGEVLRKPLVKGAGVVEPAPAGTKAGAGRRSTKPARKKPPPPSSDALKAAEAALKGLQSEKADALKQIAAARAALDEREREQRAASDRAIKAAESARGAAKRAYEAALKKWSGDDED